MHFLLAIVSSENNLETCIRWGLYIFVLGRFAASLTREIFFHFLVCISSHQSPFGKRFTLMERRGANYLHLIRPLLKGGKIILIALSPLP